MKEGRENCGWERDAGRGESPHPTWQARGPALLLPTFPKPESRGSGESRWPLPWSPRCVDSEAGLPSSQDGGCSRPGEGVGILKPRDKGGEGQNQHRG